MFETINRYVDKETGEIIRVVREREPQRSHTEQKKSQADQRLILNLLILGFCLLIALTILPLLGTYLGP